MVECGTGIWGWRDLVINRVKIRSDPFIYISEVDFKVQLKVPVQLVGERKSNEN
jgi:hypothetical protein